MMVLRGQPSGFVPASESSGGSETPHGVNWEETQRAGGGAAPMLPLHGEEEEAEAARNKSLGR